MSKLVGLELGEGDFEQQGFPATLQIAEDGKAFFAKSLTQTLLTSCTSVLLPKTQLEN